MIDIRPFSPPDLERTRDLFREYERDIGVSLCFQGFERELERLPGDYAPPAGRLLLASDGDDLVGCVALRPLPNCAGELKRMYVRPTHRGRGVARRLAERLLEESTLAGYRIVRLDTLDRMLAARALYRSLGFVEIPAYNEHSVAGTVWMERRL